MSAGTPKPRMPVRAISGALGILFYSFASSGDLSAAPVGRVPSGEARADTVTITVLPLRVDAADTVLTPLSFGLADLLAVDLARSHLVTMVERARLGAILRELDLARAGFLDSASAPRVGRLIGARQVIAGSLHRDPQGQFVIDAHVTDAETGVVDTALAHNRASLEEILAAEKVIATRLLAEMDIRLTPQEQVLFDQKPTANITALLAYGQGVQAEVNGQYAAAARAFLRAARADPSFTNARTRADQMQNAPPSAISINNAINRVNRPLETIVTTPLRGVATDPTLTSAAATTTIIIIIKLP